MDRQLKREKEHAQVHAVSYTIQEFDHWIRIDDKKDHKLANSTICYFKCFGTSFGKRNSIFQN